jgi:hypothetical protein
VFSNESHECRFTYIHADMGEQISFLILIPQFFFEIIINVTINDASWDVEFLTACPGAGALK